MTKISGIKPWCELDEEATYLLLIGPHKIPHLALVSRGNYFSLTHKKVVINEPFEPYFQYLKRLAKPLLFVELTHSPANLAQLFGAYTSADTEKITCFFPVRDALLPHSAAAYIFELIPELEKEKLIHEFYQLNMSEMLDKDGAFTLSVYSKQAIFSYIEALNNKYVNRT